MSSSAVPSAPVDRLLLVDGHSVAYRAFFGLPADRFASRTGQPVNAVYGFTSMLINLIRDEAPTHIAVAFDISRDSFRTEVYPEYKATRAETPTEFRGQIELIIEVLEALRIPVFQLAGYEADDIIATLATRAGERELPTLISSGDRDSFQLVTQICTVLYPTKGVSEHTRMTPEEVLQRYGVRADQYRELAALVGETSDNLPGVPGVGPKTAAKWIAQFGSLEQLIARIDEVKGKAGDSLRAHLSDVLRNQQLNALVRDLDLGKDVDELRWGGWDADDVDEIFAALQFRTLRDRVSANLPQAGGAGGDSGAAEEGASPKSAVVGVALEAGGVAQWLTQHGDAGVALALEGTWGRGTGTVDAIAVATSVAAAWCEVASLGPEDEGALAAWLADAARPKVLHDAKGAMLALVAQGWSLEGLRSDTALLAYLLAPDQRPHEYELDAVALRYAQIELRGESPTGQLSLGGDVGDRAALCERAVATALLEPLLEAEVAAHGGERLAHEIEIPLVPVLAAMERTGVAADLEYLTELQVRFAAEAKEATQAAHAAVGHEFNLASPKQLQGVLFDELGLPKTRKIKTGYTTDADALQGLYVQTQHPVLEHLLRFRDTAKLRSIVEGLEKSVCDDGRIHTTYSQMAAATGRLSSTDPNLQNIPIRTDEGRLIRRAFVVGNGFESLLTVDYSQIELRIMAHLSGDQALIAAFASGEDLHVTVASQVFGIPVAEVNAEARSRIKAVSYGLAYGLSPYGLAQGLGIEVAEARRLMDEFFERFGGIRDYLREVVERARIEGYTETLLGRRRYLPDLTSTHQQRRELAERAALNAPIQGSAADIMKLAMLRADAALTGGGFHSRVLLQVHDELVVELATGEREHVEQLLREAMSQAYPLTVPLDVSVGTGRTWDEAAH